MTSSTAIARATELRKAEERAERFRVRRLQAQREEAEEPVILDAKGQPLGQAEG